MNMRILDKGTTYRIPLAGFRIIGINMKRFLGLELASEDSDLANLVLEINTEFQLTHFNQKRTLDPKSQEARKEVTDLIGLTIKQCECSKTGDMFLAFNDQTKLEIPDSEYESWHLIRIRQERIEETLVIGGVGSISWYES